MIVFYIENRCKRRVFSAPHPAQPGWGVVLGKRILQHGAPELLIAYGNVCAAPVFWSFSYVCPEPVLANDPFAYRKWRKKKQRVFPHRSRGRESQAGRESLG
jgi:hypothetical protein